MTFVQITYVIQKWQLKFHFKKTVYKRIKIMKIFSDENVDILLSQIDLKRSQKKEKQTITGYLKSTRFLSIGKIEQYRSPRTDKMS